MSKAAEFLRHKLEALQLAMEGTLADLDKIPEPWAQRRKATVHRQIARLQTQIEQAWRIETAGEA